MTKPRKIAVDLTPILPGGENGGAKIFVLELLCQLARLTENTQLILLTQACSHDELAFLDSANVQRQMVLGSLTTPTVRSRFRQFGTRLVLQLPRRVSAWVGHTAHQIAIRGSKTMLRDQGIDLLFCPFTAPTYFEPGLPMICTIYDLQYKTYPQFFSPEDIRHREWTFVEACRRATAFAAISDYSRDSAIAHGSLDPARIRTIHLRMSQRITSRGDGRPPAVLDRLGLTPARYLLYPANFWKHKNHEMLLTAFGIARKQSMPEDIMLVCTGAPGARQEWLMNAARVMNLTDRVLFPGYLPNTELAALMANCSGMVFPSMYEGFGLPVIEAMAAGVPVACSNTTSLPEVVGDGAILFDPRIPTQIAQAMVSLVKDKALCARLIQAGLQRAREFSDTERMAKEYWDLFCFAVANVKHENLLTGAYADGWAGAQLSAQVAPASSPQTLELEFTVPDWLPHEIIQVTTLGRGAGASKIDMRRGQTTTLTLPFATTGGSAEIAITPTFVPAQTGHGEDGRELSIMLRRCSIVRSAGERVELFPEAGK